jgi:hypothetical protein
MPQDGSSSEQDLRDRVSKGGFAVALSGGGHRATLATLGALMAIVDRGLGPKVIQVASVSGGSITNAFVAQRCQLDKLGPGDLDSIAAELATTIIRKGVLTWREIALLALTPVLLGVVAAVFLRMLILPWAWLAIVVGFVLALAALLARGLVIEWLLDRRYFRPGTSAESRRGWSRARLASLSGRPIDHVLCMTDLVLGLPVYASSQHGGFIWRRLKPTPFDKDVWFQTFAAGQLSIAELVRASAAFPGIPPRRLRIPPDPQLQLPATSPLVAYLADGGLWNNLGTQVLREDGFIGSHAAWDRGVLRPHGKAPKDTPLLCFNGSAPLRPTQTWWFKLPGIALLKSLLQYLNILSANTVLPRIDAISSAFQRRVWTGQRPDHLDPANVVADLRASEELAKQYLPGTWTEELIRKSDPSVKKWESDALSRVRSAGKYAAKNPDTDWLAHILGTHPEPEGSYPLSGLANMEDWDALLRSSVWKQLVAKEGEGSATAPTTLGRIKSSLARRLIARAYLNTYLVSLFLAPLADGELDRLTKLPDRLDKIIGLKKDESRGHSTFSGLTNGCS